MKKEISFIVFFLLGPVVGFALANWQSDPVLVDAEKMADVQFELLQLRHFKETWQKEIRRNGKPINSDCSSLVQEKGLYQNALGYLQFDESKNSFLIKRGTKEVYNEKIVFPSAQRRGLVLEKEVGDLSQWRIVYQEDEKWNCLAVFTLHRKHRRIVSRGEPSLDKVVAVSKNGKKYLSKQKVSAHSGVLEVGSAYGKKLFSSVYVGAMSFQKNELLFWKPEQSWHWWSKDSSLIRDLCGKAYLSAYRAQAIKLKQRPQKIGRRKMFCYERVLKKTL